MIDFEHTVPIGMDICGYTQKYCSNIFIDKDSLKLHPEGKKASIWMDWESFYHTVHSMLFHEFPGGSRNAIHDNDEFWKTLDSNRNRREQFGNYSSDVVLTNEMIFSIKHFIQEEDILKVRQFLKDFALLFSRAREMNNAGGSSSSYDEPNARQIGNLRRFVLAFWNKIIRRVSRSRASATE